MGISSRTRARTATWSGTAERDTTPVPVRRPPTLDADVPARLGPYRILSRLGQGGTARVLLAEHVVLGKRVAIKTLLPHLRDYREARDMLMREARIAGAIRHRNLVDVYDFAIDADGRPYCVLELVRGETLATRIARRPLTPDECMVVTIAVTDAVATIHAAGYLHRDVKSENVLLARDGGRVVPKLIDLGIAEPIVPGDEPDRGIVGTPRAMAPEQIARDPIDERADVWALGVLAYEMLTGSFPFPGGGSLREDMLAIVTDAPAPLPATVPAALRRIIATCLQKDPDDRPASAATLAGQLRQVSRRRRQRALARDAAAAWRVIAELSGDAGVPAP